MAAVAFDDRLVESRVSAAASRGRRADGVELGILVASCGCKAPAAELYVREQLTSAACGTSFFFLSDGKEEEEEEIVGGANQSQFLFFNSCKPGKQMSGGES